MLLAGVPRGHNFGQIGYTRTRLRLATSHIGDEERRGELFTFKYSLSKRSTDLSEQRRKAQVVGCGTRVAAPSEYVQYPAS
jgi:hypothetical protein